MTYELAKQLKEAGFPVKEITADSTDTDLSHISEDGQWYLPTLSELIEACGESFGYLDKSFTQWIAGSNMQKSQVPDAQGTASSPEEAVARLWLGLNKK